MSKKSHFEYTRVIKLPPSLGDWTTLHYEEPNKQDANISPIININFDSLPRTTLKEVHLLHYNLAEKICQKISKDLNIKMELHMISASQMSYEDFLNSQTEHIVQSDLAIEGIGKINTIFDWGLADMIVNRLTGGRGEESHSEVFSDIEADLLDIELQQLISLFTETWGSVFNEEAVSSQFHCGLYKRDYTITLREAYILFNIYVGFDKSSVKKITLAYPNKDIKKLLRLKKKAKSPSKKNITLSPLQLKKTQCDIVATLGHTSLSMSDLRNLQKGDIIRLDETLNTPLKLSIGKDTTLFAQPGISNDKLSAQIIFIDQKNTSDTSVSVKAPVITTLNKEPNEVVHLDIDNDIFEQNAIESKSQKVDVDEINIEKTEAGEVEAGEVEAGEVEAGEVEAGEVEAEEFEAGEVETGEVETGEVETGEFEAEEVEAEEFEAEEFEAEEFEAEEFEAGEVEAGERETGEDEIDIDVDEDEIEKAEIDEGDVEESFSLDDDDLEEEEEEEEDEDEDDVGLDDLLDDDFPEDEDDSEPKTPLASSEKVTENDLFDSSSTNSSDDFSWDDLDDDN